MNHRITNPTRRLAVSILAFLALTAAAAFAVPTEVTAAFAKKYGQQGEVEWKKDSNGYWEGQYEKDGKEYRSDFTEDGKWIETERSIKSGDLPESVQSAVQAEHGDRKIAELEEVDNAKKGKFYDVEFDEQGPNEDFEYNADGEKLGGSNAGSGSTMSAIENGKTVLAEMTITEFLIEFGMNLITILIYACIIYYLRHHNHKMMFLLLAFNLFLFPIFLLSSVLTMGFGFTIFALLALVRLRSENFDKAEIAYLLGAVALTFINSQLSARIEIAASALVLLTAFLADHPRLWRSAYQTAEIRYRISDTEKMLDRVYLSKRISEEFKIIVNEIEIARVDRKEVRLIVVYNDPDGNAYVKKTSYGKWKLKKGKNFGAQNGKRNGSSDDK